MIRLSICIATLNRAGYIGHTLQSIMDQLTDAVEVVVVDGASTDSTAQVVAECFEGRSNCHYHRLPERGGVDQDYCRTVELAKGEFCWLMTDDDILKPMAVETVVKRLRPNLDLLVVNAEVASADMSKTLIPKRARSKDRVFRPEEQQDLLAIAGELLSFIGSVIIRRSVWESRDKLTYYGTEFVHVGVIFQRPLAQEAELLSSPQIRIRYGNAQWSSRAFDIWMFKWPSLIWSFPHITDEAKRAVVVRHPYKQLIWLFMMKVQGCFTFRDYQAKLSGRQLSWSTRFGAALLAALPEVPFNALVSLFIAPLMDPVTRLELEKSPYNFRKRWFDHHQ